MRHDAHADDPSVAFALSRLDDPTLAHVPMGIFRDVERSTYDDLVRAQIDGTVTGAGGPATDQDLADLLAGRDSWMVETAPEGVTDAADTRPAAATDAPLDEQRKGAIQGFSAYLVWGLFPLYFHALAPSGAWEILAHRILWTLVFCWLVLTIRRDWSWIRPLLRRPQFLGGIAVAAVLIAVNWVVYVAAVAAGNVADAALGYFLNPHRHRRPRRLRPAGAAATAAVGGRRDRPRRGAVPVHRRRPGAVGRPRPRRQLRRLRAAEEAAGRDPAGAARPRRRDDGPHPGGVGLVIWLGLTGEQTFTTEGPVHTSLLVLSGAVTAAPLLLFAAAARRVPLVTMGLLQFVTPVMQLLCGVVLLGERISTQRWVGFGIVWVALVILTVDSVLGVRHRRQRDAADDGVCEPAP